MIRLTLLLILFLVFGVNSIILNDLILFSLFNIGFYSVLYQKKIFLGDYLIFVCSCLFIELFTNLPLFLGAVILSIPLLLINKFISNFNFNNFFTSLLIFILSFLTFYGIDQNIYPRILRFDYFIFFIILFLLYLGLFFHGKKQD